MAFLRDRCGLKSALPGRAVEEHSEVFGAWRDGIDAGLLMPPFSVTHVDAHADLGLGDCSWMYLLSEVVFQPLDERRYPREGDDGLNEGSWLSFAVACRWVRDLTYVFRNPEGRPRDLHAPVMKEWNTRSGAVQLAAVDKQNVLRVCDLSGQAPPVEHFEPEVPLECVPWERFQAEEAFDFVYLTRSPTYTPPESDPLFELIRSGFIVEQ